VAVPDSWWIDDDLVFMHRDGALRVKEGYYRQTKLPPPPTHYLIQYIGGPFNAQQEFLSVEENLNIRQGLVWSKVDLSPQFGPNQGKSQSFQYKLTFIPQSETPFSDAQVIVGIFQE